MDYNNKQAKVGLLTNKEKTGYGDDLDFSQDVELQEFEQQKYVSFDDAKDQTKFQKKTTQVQQPQGNDSEILFRLENESEIRPPPVRQSTEAQQQLYQQPPPYQQNFNRAQTMPQQRPPQQQQVVTCTQCKTQQFVQDQTKAFSCYRCTFHVYPVFGIFICGICKYNVRYQLGISNVVKCGGCQTINYVPVQVPPPPQHQPYASIPPPQPLPQAQAQPALRPPPPMQEVVLENENEKYVPIFQKNKDL